MLKVGKRLYYDKTTGEIIFEVSERTYFEDVTIPTIEQDILTFKILSERNRNTFDVLELPYGAYAQDFAECNGYRVNPQTLELEFSYPDPNATEPQDPVYVKPLTEQIEELRQENITTLLALTEVYEMIIGGGGV
jgi:hypothetical protein